MSRPDKEQIESDRRYLARMAQAAAFSRETAEAIERLLAVTAEPSEKELVEEARAWADRKGCGQLSRCGYIAGAQREGAR